MIPYDPTSRPLLPYSWPLIILIKASSTIAIISCLYLNYCSSKPPLTLTSSRRKIGVTLAPPFFFPLPLSSSVCRLRKLLEVLEDIAVDVPKAPVHLGEILGKLTAVGALHLDKVCAGILEGGPEPGLFVDSGFAGDLLASYLAVYREHALDPPGPEGPIADAKIQPELFLAEYERGDAKKVAQLKEKLKLPGGDPAADKVGGVPPVLVLCSTVQAIGDPCPGTSWDLWDSFRRKEEPCYPSPPPRYPSLPLAIRLPSSSPILFAVQRAEVTAYPYPLSFLKLP